MNILTIAFRNLGRHKRRTVFSISTIVIACILGLFMLSLITGMKTDMKKNILGFYTGAVQIRHADFNKYDYLNPIHLYVEDEVSLRENLLQIDGVTRAVGRITAGGKLYIDENNEDDIPGKDFAGMALGIDISAEADILDPAAMLKKGRLPEMGSREVALGYGLAEKAGLDVGDKFAFLTITAGRSPNAMTFTIVGLVQFSMGGISNSYFILPLDTMQGFMQMPGGAQEIIVMTKDPENAEVQRDEINKLLTTELSYSYLESKFWKDYGQFYAMLGIAQLIYNVIVIFFLVLGATVIINTTMMVIYERYREIGILGAMGMRPKELVRLFFSEALIAGIISGVIGISLGTVLILILEKTGLDFGSAMSSLEMEISNIIYPDLKLYQVILMAFYTVGITALVTLLPIKKVANIEPDEAIRST
jgi:putative ABC transport system permease protein